MMMTPFLFFQQTAEIRSIPAGKARKTPEGACAPRRLPLSVIETQIRGSPQSAPPTRGQIFRKGAEMSLPSVEEISVEQLHQWLADGKSFHLIDVREQNEWDQGHVAEAVLNPMSAFDVTTLPEEPDATVVFMCRSGKRSMTVASHLANDGIVTGYNLAGGILAWADAGYPVVR